MQRHPHFTYALARFVVATGADLWMTDEEGLTWPSYPLWCVLEARILRAVDRGAFDTAEELLGQLADNRGDRERVYDLGEYVATLEGFRRARGDEDQ